MIERQVKAWADFPEWKKITDDDIKEIIETTMSTNHSNSSDEARGAILKLYSYETPLYDTVNKANQYQDKRAIQTLGPYACLLFNTLLKPTTENKKVMDNQARDGKDEYGYEIKRTTLYRGLGLPEKAL